MATFAEIKTEVNLLLIDTPAAIQTLVPRFVNRAIRGLQKRHNFHVMKASVSYSTVAEARLLGATPDDWKQARDKAYITTSRGSVIELTTVAEEIEALAATGANPDFDYGQPRFIRLGETQFEVYPFPDGMSDYDDGEYRVTVPYWKYLPDLTGDGATNWFTINAEEAVIWSAVSDGFYANEDEGRAQIWQSRAFEARRQVLNTEKYRQMSDTQTLVPHFGALKPHTSE